MRKLQERYQKLRLSQRCKQKRGKIHGVDFQLNQDRFNGLDLNTLMPRTRLSIARRFSSIELMSTVKRLQILSLLDFQDQLAKSKEDILVLEHHVHEKSYSEYVKKLA